jgi:hypothetical protein
MYEQAIEYFERAAKVQPSEVKWQLMVTSCYRRLGDYNKALELYLKIHEEHPENIEALQYVFCYTIVLPSSLVCDVSVCLSPIYLLLPACLHSLTPHGTSLTIPHPPLTQSSIINHKTHIAYYNIGTSRPCVVIWGALMTSSVRSWRSCVATSPRVPRAVSRALVVEPAKGGQSPRRRHKPAGSDPIDPAVPLQRDRPGRAAPITPLSTRWRT